MVFLSIVIPAYNSSSTIDGLLHSISLSKSVDFDSIEVIVVDDKSTDDTLEKSGKFLNSRKNKIKKSKIIRLKTNGGPARARNIGVKYAKGEIILFLDSDVQVYNNTLFEIIRSFKDDYDLFAITGVWDKKQKTHKFFPKYKALRDWSYWINERDPNHYYYLFSTRIAAIKKDLFLRLGGFNTTYKAALVEDMELTYRIARRYAVVFNPKAKVAHEFEDFVPIARKYFWRSFYWSRIYRERKKFDPVATTVKEALTTISAAGFSVSLVLAGFCWIFLSWNDSYRWLFLHMVFSFICIFFLVIHLWGVYKFLRFAYKEEGLMFAVKSFLTGIILYIIILSGSAYSFVKKD
jgi:glycosyltransferase involved in cell wall biosynthesis